MDGLSAMAALDRFLSLAAAFGALAPHLAWHAPGPGRLVHNPPGIVHAMRGTDVPLLAIWFLLPLDQPALLAA